MQRHDTANNILLDIQSSHRSVMIISTQTPSSIQQASGLTPGITGKLIQQLTRGGMVYMHRDKQIRVNESTNEMEIFKEHLKPNGWLIITGHGGPDSVRGQYRQQLSFEETSILDISCSADDYVNLAMQSDTLKNGDHINIVLYVCFAATRFNDQKCFAEKIAEGFALKGISTTIIASTGIVKRANSFKNELGDIRDSLLIFRTHTSSIRVLNTTPDHSPQQFSMSVFSSGRRFCIMQDQMHFELSSAEIREAIINEDIATHDDLVPDFHRNRKEVELCLADSVGRFIIRQSSKPNAFAISYCDITGEIKHYLFFCEIGEDKKPRIASSQAGDPQKIIAGIRQLRTAFYGFEHQAPAAAARQAGH